jgi:hypothetical protein
MASAPSANLSLLSLRPAIEKFWREGLALPVMQNSRATREVRSIRLVRPDVAVVTVDVKLALEDTAGSVLDVFVVAKDTDWRIATHHNLRVAVREAPGQPEKK